MNKTAEKLESEALSATLVLSGVVRQLMEDGVEAASLVEALTSALGVMMAAAPRVMADQLAKAVYAKLLQQRAETWAEVDAAAPVH